MMQATIKERCGPYGSSVAGSIAINGDNLNLRASMTDATFFGGPSLNDLCLSLEKPGFFIVDYDVPKEDFRFQFMNTIRVANKPLNLTYTHARGDNSMAIDGTLVLDSANKLSANYSFDSGNCKFKYSYVHGDLTTFEPSYDVAKNAWDFSVSRRVDDDIVVRASYQTSTKVLGLDWLVSSPFNLKASASLNLAEKRKMAILSTESTWNFEV